MPRADLAKLSDAQLHAYLSNCERKLFVAKAVTEGVRPLVEQRFYADLRGFFYRWFGSIARMLADEGVLQQAVRERRRFAGKLGARERRLAGDEVTRALFADVSDIVRYGSERRALMRRLREFEHLMYDIGAVTALQSMGYRATSRRLAAMGYSADRLLISKAVSESGDIVFDVGDQEIADWMEARVVKHGAGITNAVIEDARRIVRDEVFGKDRDVHFVGQEIASAHGIPEWRGLKIARTEAGQTFNSAMFDTYARSGVQRHSWVTVGDRRVRPQHVDNEVAGPIKVGELFPSGQYHPGHGVLSINCRCTVFPDLSDPNILLDPWDGSASGFHLGLPDPEIVGNSLFKKRGVSRTFFKNKPGPKPKGIKPVDDSVPVKTVGKSKDFKDATEAAEEYADELYKGHLESLSARQRQSLEDYSGMKFAEIQAVLRKSDGWESADMAFVRRVVGDVDRAMAKAPPLPENLVAYRGIQNPKFIESLKTGTEFVDDAFVSTSLSREVAEEVMDLGIEAGPGALMRIRVPQGMRATWMREVSQFDEQAELLLPRGMRFRVTKKHAPAYKGGPPTLDVDVVAAPKSAVQKSLSELADDDALTLALKGPMPSTVAGLEQEIFAFDDAIKATTDAAWKKKASLRRTHLKQKWAKVTGKNWKTDGPQVLKPGTVLPKAEAPAKLKTTPTPKTSPVPPTTPSSLEAAAAKKKVPYKFAKGKSTELEKKRFQMLQAEFDEMLGTNISVLMDSDFAYVSLTKMSDDLEEILKTYKQMLATGKIDGLVDTGLLAKKFKQLELTWEDSFLSMSGNQANGTYQYYSGKIKLATKKPSWKGWTATNADEISVNQGTWKVGNGVKGTTKHEMGHAVHHALWDAKPDAKIEWHKIWNSKSVYASTNKKHWEKVVSKYAGTNDRELFAETFAAWSSPKYKKGMLPTEIEAYFEKWLGANKLGRKSKNILHPKPTTSPVVKPAAKPAPKPKPAAPPVKGEPVTWKPVMTAEEAKAWAATSKFKKHVTHVTTDKKIANMIMEGGFDPDKKTAGKLWGHGIYTSTDSATTKFYQQYIGKDFPDATTLKLQINVENPFTLDVSTWGGLKLQASVAPRMVAKHADVEEMFLSLRSAMKKNNEKILDEVTGKMTWQEIDALKKAKGFVEPDQIDGLALKTSLEAKGHDSLHIIDGKFRESVGGSQFIVFDQKKITVIDDVAAKKFKGNVPDVPHVQKPDPPGPATPAKPVEMPGTLTDLKAIEEGQQGVVYKAKLNGEEVSYKPLSGEKISEYHPNMGTAREKAANLIDQQLGWNLTPDTAIKDGPDGVGLVKQWIKGKPIDIENAGVGTQAARTKHGVFDFLIANNDSVPQNTLVMSDGTIKNIDVGGAFTSQKEMAKYGYVNPFANGLGEKGFDKKLADDVVQSLQDLVANKKAMRSQLSPYLTEQQIDEMFDRAEILLKHQDDFHSVVTAASGTGGDLSIEELFKGVKLADAPKALGHHTDEFRSFDTLHPLLKKDAQIKQHRLNLEIAGDAGDTSDIAHFSKLYRDRVKELRGTMAAELKAFDDEIRLAQLQAMKKAGLDVPDTFPGAPVAKPEPKPVPPKELTSDVSVSGKVINEGKPFDDTHFWDEDFTFQGNFDFEDLNATQLEQMKKQLIAFEEMLSTTDEFVGTDLATQLQKVDSLLAKYPKKPQPFEVGVGKVQFPNPAKHTPDEFADIGAAMAAMLDDADDLKKLRSLLVQKKGATDVAFWKGKLDDAILKVDERLIKLAKEKPLVVDVPKPAAVTPAGDFPNPTSVKPTGAMPKSLHEIEHHVASLQHQLDTGSFYFAGAIDPAMVKKYKLRMTHLRQKWEKQTGKHFLTDIPKTEPKPKVKPVAKLYNVEPPKSMVDVPVTPGEKKLVGQLAGAVKKEPPKPPTLDPNKSFNGVEINDGLPLPGDAFETALQNPFDLNAAQLDDGIGKFAAAMVDSATDSETKVMFQQLIDAWSEQKNIITGSKPVPATLQKLIGKGDTTSAVTDVGKKIKLAKDESDFIAKALATEITGAMPKAPLDIEEQVALITKAIEVKTAKGGIDPAWLKKAKLRTTHLKQKWEKSTGTWFGTDVPKSMPKPKGGAKPFTPKPKTVEAPAPIPKGSFSGKKINGGKSFDPDDVEGHMYYMEFDPADLNKQQLKDGVTVLQDWKDMEDDLEMLQAINATLEKLQKQLAKYDPIPTPVSAPVPKSPAVETHVPPVASVSGNPAIKVDALKFPAASDIDKLETVSGLGGSTGAKLVRDPATGRKYVLKRGANVGHLREEQLADDLYRKLGIEVPDGVILETPSGPVKLTVFEEHDVTDLGSVLKAGGERAKIVKAKLAEDFAADALLGNWDVVGMSSDNVLVVGKGTDVRVLRIDNGGSLRYRAMGSQKGKQWSADVTEITSMRDAKINPTTAKVFGGLKDKDVAHQIRRMALRRDDLLEGVPVEVKEVLAKRLDNLEKWADDILGVEPKTRAPVVPKRPSVKDRPNATPTKQQPAYDPASAAKRTSDAKVNGVNLATDGGDIEDTNVLVWQEKSSAGKPITKVSMKVTASGSRKIEKVLKDSGVDVATPKTHPKDTFWDSILGAVKTVNHHASDGQYNQSKLTALKAAKKELKSATGLPSDMKKQYLEWMDEILAAADEQRATKGMFTQYVPKPPKNPKATSAPLKIESTRRDYVSFRTASFTKGEAKQVSGLNQFGNSDQMYIVKLEDGVEVRFVPTAGSHTEQAGLAFQGTVDIAIEGSASPASIKRAMKVLEDFGIETAPPTPEFEEMLYIHRSVYLRNDHKLAAYKKVWEDTSLSESDKLDMMRAWAEKRYKVKFPPRGEATDWYNPMGYSKGSDGSGTRHWMRWDLPADKIEKDMAGYALKHNTSGTISDVIPQILDSGGEMTTTVGRVRKGVNVSSTGGMSSSTDVHTGGASYFFTRIHKYSAAGGKPKNRGLYFKVRNLARQDHVSYGSDKYGRISALNTRAATVDKYKKFAGQGGNETIFKEGFNLLDEIEFIGVSSTSERMQVIKAFHDRGIRRLPDGRLVEDIVIAV